MKPPALSPPTRRGGPAPVFYWINNYPFLIGTLMVFALVLDREGDRVPSGNERV